MPKDLTENDVEWQECRRTIGRLDSTIADFRKYSFTLVTGLITATGFLGQRDPTSLTTLAAVPTAIMMLVAILFAVDRYYSVLLSGAVQRALDIEGPGINPDDLTRDNLTQVIAIQATRSWSPYIAAFLYIILLVATHELGRAMPLQPAAYGQIENIFHYCAGGIVGYFGYTEYVNRTGFMRSQRYKGKRLKPLLDLILFLILAWALILLIQAWPSDILSTLVLWVSMHPLSLLGAWIVVIIVRQLAR